MRFPSLGYLFVLTIPLIAGLASVSGIEIAGLSLTGWLWSGALLSALLLMVVAVPLEQGRKTPFPYLIWCLPLGYLWLSLTWVERIDWDDVQEAIQISMPVLVACLASRYVRTAAQGRQLINFYLVMLTMFAVASIAVRIGLVEAIGLQDNNRLVAMGISLGGILLLAPAAGPNLRPWLGWVLCILLAWVTESRMATAALLVVPFFHPNFRSAVWRVGALSLSLTIGLGLFYTPVFQKRFFHSGSGGLSDLLTDDFASFGRFEAWPYVWKAAWVHPAWGAGVGSTYELVDQVWPEAHHIHNDYLRLFYELGFLGLGCFAVVVLWQCSDLLRKMQRAEGESRRLFSAAFLGLMYYAMLASTDNPVVYCAIFTNPLFALMGAAYGLSVGEDSSASLPVQPSLPQPSYPRSSLPQPTLLPQKTPPHPA